MRPTDRRAAPVASQAEHRDQRERHRRGAPAAPAKASLREVGGWGASRAFALAPARFLARRRPQTSGAAGAVKAGARALCAPPGGLGLDVRPVQTELAPMSEEEWENRDGI